MRRTRQSVVWALMMLMSLWAAPLSWAAPPPASETSKEGWLETVNTQVHLWFSSVLEWLEADEDEESPERATSEELGSDPKEPIPNELGGTGEPFG